MIEMMMGHDHFRQRFIRNERPRLVDLGLRVGFAPVCFEHRQVIIELEHRRISSGTSQIPDSLRDRYRFNVEPRRRWRWRRSNYFGSGEIDHGPIDYILVDI